MGNTGLLHYFGVSATFSRGRILKKTAKHCYLVELIATFAQPRLCKFFGWFWEVWVACKRILAIFHLRKKDFMLYQSMEIFLHHSLEKDRWIFPVLDRTCKIWTNIFAERIMPSFMKIPWSLLELHPKKNMTSFFPYMATGGHFGLCDHFSSLSFSSYSHF